MHELGIMESAMSTVLAQARDHGARQVHRIVLRIGALAGVEPQALRFAFEIVSRGTPADGAELSVETVPARVHCADCAADFEVAGGFVFTCPRCRALCADLRQGRELELARIEMT